MRAVLLHFGRRDQRQVGARSARSQPSVWDVAFGERSPVLLAISLAGNLTVSVAQLLYYRRTRRRDVPLISDIKLLPPAVTPSGDGDWVKTTRSLRDGVVRSSPLFLWYLKGKTLQDISEVERQSLITELDVVYGDGDPWYGFERLSPPTTEKSARAESVSITMRRGVKCAFIVPTNVPCAHPGYLTLHNSPATRSTPAFLSRRTLQDHADCRPTFLRWCWALS